jgi:hypothetical protein
MVSFTGKETHPAYYAPFGSTIGSDRPERGWFTSLDYKLFAWLSAGAAASSEKHLSLSTGDDELPYIRREEVRAKLSWKVLKSSHASIRRLTQVSDGNRHRRTQYAHSSRIAPFKIFRLTFSALYQAGTGAGDSSSVTAGIGFTFLRENEISFFYCRTRASAENPVYTVLSPIEQSSIPGMLVRETAHTGVLRILLRHEDLSFSLRYMRQYVGSASHRSRLEFAGSAYF